MYYELFELFAFYLLISLVFQGFQSILPKTITNAFSFVGELRKYYGRLVISLFNSEDNMEVSVLAVFISPFIMGLMAMTLLTSLVLFNSDTPFINFWIILTVVFVVSAIAPSPEEMQVFRQVSKGSTIVFILKLFIVMQLISTTTGGMVNDAIIMGLLVTPISRLVIK